MHDILSTTVHLYYDAASSESENIPWKGKKGPHLWARPADDVVVLGPSLLTEALTVEDEPPMLDES